MVNGTTHDGFVSMELMKVQSPLPDRTHSQPLDLNVLDHRPDRRVEAADRGRCSGLIHACVPEPGAEAGHWSPDKPRVLMPAGRQ